MSCANYLKLVWRKKSVSSILVLAYDYIEKPTNLVSVLKFGGSRKPVLMNQFYEEKLQMIQIQILMQLLTLYNKKGKRKTEDDEEENKQEAFN